MKDVLQHINKSDESYQHIYVCAGYNDCSSESFDGEAITKTYKGIIDAAKKKVLQSQFLVSLREVTMKKHRKILRY